MFIIVDLPEPLDPMNATNSPGWDRERHAADGVYLAIAGAVDLLDVDQINEGSHGKLLGRMEARTNVDHPAAPPKPPPADFDEVPLNTATTTWSPAFKPPSTSVYAPSVMPVLISRAGEAAVAVRADLCLFYLINPVGIGGLGLFGHRGLRPRRLTANPLATPPA